MAGSDSGADAGNYLAGLSRPGVPFDDRVIRQNDLFEVVSILLHRLVVTSQRPQENFVIADLVGGDETRMTD